MRPIEEVTILTYRVSAGYVTSWLVSPEMGRTPDPRLHPHGRQSRLTEACVSETDEGPVLELKFTLDRA